MMDSPVSVVGEVNKGDPNKTTTQDDFNTLVKEFQFENTQSRYNDLSLLKSITEIQGIITNLVNSMSKTNKQLLGDIIGSLVVTEWLDQGTIKVCGCTKPNISVTKSHCSDK